MRLGLSAAVLSIVSLALATPTGARERSQTPAPKSIGSPTEGRLEGAAELGPSPTLALRHKRGAHWGLPRLVGMLERAAARVNRLYAGSVLVVGDLSERHGGDISGHKSHESGRDADVGFFFVDANGKSLRRGDFLQVNEHGNSRKKSSLSFDVARNWALVESFVTDREARVEHIFVSNAIRAQLLAHARRKGTYLPVLHRASLAMKQPRRGLAHDDHFHVRIACPPKQSQVCVSEPSVLTATSRSGKKKAAQSLVKQRKRREATRR